MEPCGECESCISFQEGRSYCIHELDAASNNGVEDIKALMDQVQIPPQVGKYSVYIIDEVHMLSQSAFNAFLKTLEEPPAHAIFILATTEKHKILPTILSRCQTYDFNRISVSDIVMNLRGIASKEGINVDDESLHIIAQKADGAMRDALTIFDQTVAFCGTDIRYEDVIRNLNVLDFEYSFKLVDAFRNGDYATAMLVFDEILAKGFNAQHFISALSSHLRDLIVSKTAGLEALLDMPASLKGRYKEQADACELGFLYGALEITSQCEAGYKAALNQRLHIEFALMKLSFLKNGVPSVGQAVVSPLKTSATQTLERSEVGKTAGDSRGQIPLNEGGTSSQGSSPSSPIAAPSAVEQSEVRISAPASAKAVEPRRRGVKTGASLSLKSIMEEPEEAVEQIVEKEATKAAELTDEEIAAKWKSLAELYPSQPRLANTIANAKVETSREGDELTVTFMVTNESQRSWIEAHKLHELEGHFQKALGKAAVKLLVGTVQYTEEKVIYTPEDKAKYLMENVPEVIDIISDLGLDIK